MLKRSYYKYSVISFSLILIAFSGYQIQAQTFIGWNLDPNISFIIDNSDKMFYALGEDLSNIQMQNDRLRLTHETGAWGFQYEGQESNITDFADSGNDFITTLNNNATVATISNNTVYWPPDMDSPKSVNVTSGTEIKILAANFKLDINAFNLAIPPVVFIDPTTSRLIVKSNHTVQQTTVEISFQEDVDTGILADAPVIFLMFLIIAGFILIIYLVVKKK